MTDPRGGPIGGASNWTRGLHAGRAIRARCSAAGRSPLLDLATPAGVSPQTQRSALDLLERAERAARCSRARRDANWPPASSPTSWPTACRPPPPRSSICRPKTPQTLEMYGLDDPLTADFGRKCLITRRLIEQGVRFVQLYSGGGHIEDTWDGHNDCITNHKPARRRDRPADRAP